MALEKETAQRIHDAGLTLQDHIGLGNIARGFHAEGDFLRTQLDLSIKSDRKHGLERSHATDQAEAALRNYYMTKMMLIVTEAAEAAEELRNGRKMAEQYLGEGGKPEGAPSELADIVIRCFDLADEANIDLMGVILNKLEYNATRSAMHGGKTV